MMITFLLLSCSEYEAHKASGGKLTFLPRYIVYKYNCKSINTVLHSPNCILFAYDKGCTLFGLSMKCKKMVRNFILSPPLRDSSAIRVISSKYVPVRFCLSGSYLGPLNLSILHLCKMQGEISPFWSLLKAHCIMHASSLQYPQRSYFAFLVGISHSLPYSWVVFV